MKSKIVLAISMGLAVSACTTKVETHRLDPVTLPVTTADCARPARADAVEAQVLAWINGERQKRGIAPYRRSAQLEGAARGHACAMAATGQFAHSLPNGPSLTTRIKATGYPMRLAGENIAYSTSLSASAPTTSWRNSPPHWRTILDPALSDIGIAVATSADGKAFWVMNAAAPR